MPHLMVNNSASVLVTLTAWWIVFIRGLLWVCMCTIDMATEEDEEDFKIILLSNCTHNLLSFSLLNTLRKIQSKKLSITLRPGENSKSKRLKDRKHSLILLVKSTK